MANLNVTLRSLPGSDKSVDIELNGTATTKPEGVETYEAYRLDEDRRHLTDAGRVRKRKKRIRRGLRLSRVIVSRSKKEELDELRRSRVPVVVSPVWDESVLTYLPLQDTLSDSHVKASRTDITFARSSGRFNPTSGRAVTWPDDTTKAPLRFNAPVFSNAGFGRGINISDVVNDTHEPSYQYKAYIDTDATDVGSITRLFLSDDYDADTFYVGQYVMVSTEYQTNNAFEVARVDAIGSGTNYLDLAQTAASDAVLTNTSSYTVANRTYVQGWNLVSDGEMDESGTASWADASGGAPSLKAKSATQQETGTRCMRLIGNGDTTGIQQSIGAVPAGTDLYIFARVKVILGTLLVNVRDDTNAADNAEAAAGGGDWEWVRFAMESERGGSGQNTIILKFTQSGATTLEALIDRVYIFVNELDNGGFEGTYDDESGGGGGTVNVAPGWNNSGAETDGTDTLDTSTDEHGGDAAQSINVDATNEGVITDSTPIVSGVWYRIGGYIKATSGVARIGPGNGAFFAQSTTTGSYEFIEVVGTTSAQTVRAYSALGAANFLVDDVFARRLPGNPHDDAYYDHDPLATDGFSVLVSYTPDVANTALDVDAYIWSASRRTYDAANDITLYYDESVNSFVLDVDGTTATVAKTFSAGDEVLLGCQVTGAAGSQVVRLTVMVNGGAVSNNSSAAAATTPSGITRVWLGRLGSGYTNPARGTVSALLVENAALTDAQVEALLDRLSGADPDALAFLEETHGILYEVVSSDFEPIMQSDLDYFKGTVALEEIDRIGEVAVQD